MSSLTKEMAAVQDAIAREDYEEAEKLFQRAGVRRGSKAYDDTVAILDASIGAVLHDRVREWEALRAGLAFNCKNYELYVMLGNYYLEENPRQSYLCYENALHHCDVAEDRAQIQDLLERLCGEYQVRVNKAAFVILSYNLLNLTRDCIESIRLTVPESAREIIIVDNASEDGSVEWLREQKDIKLIENKENKGFPAGCNQGIAAAEPDSDIFLLNNDTLMPENALFWLRMGLYSAEDVGTTGSVSNNVSNFQRIRREWGDTASILQFGRENNIPMRHPYEDKLFLVGFALLIKRSVLDKIGGLDERFSPGNSEDEDYGLRVVEAGYRNLLCRNSFILHFGHKSFEKAGARSYDAVLQTNRRKIDQKWEMDTLGNLFPHPEMINMIKEPKEKAFRVLNIDCGCGADMRHLRGLYPKISCYGVEPDQRAVRFAAPVGEVIHADVEKLQFPWQPGFFDYVLIVDHLELLKDPDAVLRKIYKVLKPGGRLIARAFNARHFSVVLPLLLHDVLPYGNAGALNVRYSRMYTSTELQRFMARNGYQGEELLYLTKGEPNEPEAKLIEQLAEMMKIPDRNSFLAYEYVLKVIKPSAP